MGNGQSRNAAKMKSMVKLTNLISPVPSDIEVAQAATVVPIKTVAAACGLSESDYEPYGHYKAKVRVRARNPPLPPPPQSLLPASSGRRARGIRNFLGFATYPSDIHSRIKQLKKYAAPAPPTATGIGEGGGQVEEGAWRGILRGGGRHQPDATGRGQVHHHHRSRASNGRGGLWGRRRAWDRVSGSFGFVIVSPVN